MLSDTQKKIQIQDEVVSADRTLIIGDLGRWRNEGRDVISFGEFEYIDLADLTVDLLERTKPAIILSPLVADSFDVIDIAARLAELGFEGRYRALSVQASDKKVIAAEVALVAPDLDFDILEIK